MVRNTEAKNFTLRLPKTIAEQVETKCREISFKDDRTYRPADFFRDAVESKLLTIDSPEGKL